MSSVARTTNNVGEIQHELKSTQLFKNTVTWCWERIRDGELPFSDNTVLCFGRYDRRWRVDKALMLRSDIKNEFQILALFQSKGELSSRVHLLKVMR